MSTRTHTILWSPAGVSFVDSKGVVHAGADLASLAREFDLRSAIVLIVHRNSLIRTTKVPNLKRPQLEPLVRAKTNSLFPGGTPGFSFGFRVGNDPSGEGKLAILGGTKTDTLRRIYSDAQGSGIKILAVVPAAFAGWNAANLHNLRNGIVLSRENSDVCMDVVSEGELVYSRFTQARTPSEILDEIEATFQTAGVVQGSVLCLGQIDLPGSQGEPREASTFLSDLGVINRTLFHLELPEAEAKRENKKVYASAQRGAALLAIAAVAWTFVILKHQKDVLREANATKIEKAMNAGEKKKLTEISKETTALRQKEHLLNAAFNPAQTFGDMVAVLGRDSDKVWLTGLSIERGGTLSVRGGAQNQKAISDYVHKLRKEPRFRDVQLRFSTKGQLNNVTIYQFAINAWAVGNLPFDQNVEEVSR